MRCLVIFTGGNRSESIKAWDPRASSRSCIYELSTGNNIVTSLAWDAPRSTLYAATECSYMDRLGYHHDYRAVRRPRSPKEPKQGNHMDVDDEDEDEYDDEDEYEEDYDPEDQYWPKNAFHDEKYFGYLLDSGDHRLSESFLFATLLI